MAYEKYTWVTGEVITQEKLNHMEDGIAAAFTDDMKAAILECFGHVAWADDTGAALVNELRLQLYNITLESISAVYTQSGTVFSTDDLDSLKADLVVTANYSDGTSDTVLSSMYELSGTLTDGTSTITVSFDGKEDTFDVTVTGAEDVTPLLSSFEATNPDYVGTTVDAEAGTVLVYTKPNVSRTYQGVRTSFTTEAGYAYKVDVDYAAAQGKAKIGMTNTGGTLVTYSGTETGSGHFSLDVPNDDTIAYFFLYCTWATAEAGAVTYSNLKVIKYAT